MVTPKNLRVYLAEMKLSTNEGMVEALNLPTTLAEGGEKVIAFEALKSAERKLQRSATRQFPPPAHVIMSLVRPSSMEGALENL